MSEAPRSLRRRVRTVFLMATVIAVLVTVLGALGLRSLLDARAQLVDRVDPALATSERLLAAMVDQETGVRAYVLVAQEPFLEPYERGRAEQGDAEAELRRTLEGDTHVDDELRRVTAAAEAWRRDYAVPTITAAEAGSRTPAEPEALEAGRRTFDEVRSAITDLQAGLRDERALAKDDLDEATTRLVLILLVAAVTLVAIVGGLWRLVRRSVQQPLDELGEAARRVAGGDVDHRVEPVGPAEVWELALAMELMRARVVEDLVQAEATRGEIERQSRELERSNAELEQFAYVASHDLQEPLRKVASFCQLLQARYGGQLDERADQYIDFAVDGAKRMQSLINDLLAFSRVGRLPADQEVVDLGDALQQARANLATALEESGATVTVDGELPSVRGEAALLIGVFQNLLANAVKFRREGTTPEITVTATRRGDVHEIAVSDDGIGIAPDYAERVFIIFQRLHPKERYEGTGIGLALCRKIVEYHGGRIHADVEVAAGTTIRFTLPALEGTSP